MNISAPFIARPVATALLTIGIALSGALAFFKLPVAPVPQVDIPTVTVLAQLPGASPETVANSVASPLERHLGRIADVTEMTSSSSLGFSRIGLQFGLDRDIDGAARDVQAGINAARADLPTNLRTNPTYRKVNPADAPIMILALTSKTLTRGQMYDAASNILQQRLSQLEGVGQVIIAGATLPAVRVELDLEALNKFGIGFEDVRAALASANANSPKGAIEQGDDHFQIYDNDQASRAADYAPLVIAYRNGNAVRLSDVAEVRDSVEDLRNAGYLDEAPSVVVIPFTQPGANIIDTVERLKAELPRLEAAMPGDINVKIAGDKSLTIRASLEDTETTLAIAVVLVVLVVYFFLRDIRATLVPSIAVPVSIVGSFGVMYLAGFTLDILSLMALTIATGFVVDDAVVVVENISRHLEAGMPRREAALRGAGEVGFTVLSISLSLVAVFTPILFMGGVPGRFFREFALTLSIAILISLLVSLTATPMLCALLLRSKSSEEAQKPKRPGFFERLLGGYERSLLWALRHRLLVLAILAATVALNFELFRIAPKGFFPEQDTGRITGVLRGDQSVSFQAMSKKLSQMIAMVRKDPAVDNVIGFTGAGSGGAAAAINTASVYVNLKPLSDRKDSASEVIARLRPALSEIPGGEVFLSAIQDFRVGARQSNALYQYTMLGADADLYSWTPKLVEALSRGKALKDVSSDQQLSALESDVVIDRETASRLGIVASQVDNTLYDAFGQRQVSVIYSANNQYHVVMEANPRNTQRPSSLKDIYVSTAGGPPRGTATTNFPVGTAVESTAPPQTPSTASTSRSAAAASLASVTATARNAQNNALAVVGNAVASTGSAVSTNQENMVPLSAISRYKPGLTALSINHQGLFVATTISFNLALGASLSDALAEIERAAAEIHMPPNLRGSLTGTAELFTQALRTEPYLILAGVTAVYIVLGILYESFVHPITILSTLPSAGVGAILALLLLHTEFSIIAFIGVILLIGIVKKNAILMIDFAIDARRLHGASSYDAIYQACLLRFRPIMMTTMAAILGAAPLALSFGNGGEVRRPLGIAIVGGLIVSQALTLYTTPVIYLYLDQFSNWAGLRWRGFMSRITGRPDY
ncbi:efflux RND transporter permease subunit [Methylocystis heyeri]|uniref:MMPL family transporter n=1 Tax=Methylocystis heyeri TaxID=391905 RepID=A0A6B8KD55_9HYPH|nr:efflux RND transporter permease subunit [Methylocystis heyeri]QGM45512.1 MMPL family transporter [Methylocystis heyeri]